MVSNRWMRGGTGVLSARQSGKMVVPLLCVLAVLAMGVAGVAIYLMRQEHEQLQAKDRQLQLTETENDDLKSRLTDSQQARVRAEDELVSSRKELVDAKDGLTKAVKAQEALTQQVEAREQEIARLGKDLQQAKQDSQGIKDQLASLQSERDTFKKQLTDLQQAKTELESKVMELSDRPTVELDKVLVTGEPSSAAMVMPASTSGPATGSPTAQVMVVNRDYDFIVMNQGKNHGVAVGQEFQIIRGNDVLGRVKVEKVYDELSAAAMLPDSKKNQIREGDGVRPL